jgi:hypothetical protein
MKTKIFLPFLILIFFYSLLISCSSSSNSPKEGFIDVKGGKVWYRINGTGNKPALLLLHGGPGSTHEYFECFDSYFPKAEIHFDRFHVVKLLNDKIHLGRSILFDYFQIFFSF